jgi:hypothetical protein
MAVTIIYIEGVIVMRILHPFCKEIFIEFV